MPCPGTQNPAASTPTDVVQNQSTTQLTLPPSPNPLFFVLFLFCYCRACCWNMQTCSRKLTRGLFVCICSTGISPSSPSRKTPFFTFLNVPIRFAVFVLMFGFLLLFFCFFGTTPFFSCTSLSVVLRMQQRHAKTGRQQEHTQLARTGCRCCQQAPKDAPPTFPTGVFEFTPVEQHLSQLIFSSKIDAVSQRMREMGMNRERVCMCACMCVCVRRMRGRPCLSTRRCLFFLDTLLALR